MPSKYYYRNFKPQYYYHVFNRGSYKHKIFHDTADYKDFLGILTYYLKYPTAKKFSYQKLIKKKKLLVRNQINSVRLIAYCLMPNHFHFILKQMPPANQKTGISNLMRRTMITYSMHFQYKYKHQGNLFQGRYKNVKIDTDKQLLHLSKYIHQNPAKLTKNLETYPFSSLPYYLNQAKTVKWLYPEYVLKLVSNYNKFIRSPAKKSDAKKLKNIKLD